jgi:hypothetical protein
MKTICVPIPPVVNPPVTDELGGAPVLREAIKAGTLRVDAAVYDLATGKVSMR